MANTYPSTLEDKLCSMDKEDLEMLLFNVCSILWLDNDGEWTADTPADIANLLEQFHPEVIDV